MSGHFGAKPWSDEVIEKADHPVPRPRTIKQHQPDGDIITMEQITLGNSYLATIRVLAEQTDVTVGEVAFALSRDDSILKGIGKSGHIPSGFPNYLKNIRLYSRPYEGLALASFFFGIPVHAAHELVEMAASKGEGYDEIAAVVARIGYSYRKRLIAAIGHDVDVELLGHLRGSA